MIGTKKPLLIFSAIISTAAVVVTAIIWNSSLKRAHYTFDGYEIDGKYYTWVDHREPGSYKETWNIVCKTDDGTWTFYEIDIFPDHEYLVARCFYNAEIIKHID